MLKEKLGSVKIGERGQIVIPARIRRSLNLKAGDRMDLYLNEKQELVLTRNGQVRQIRDLVSKERKQI